MRVSGEDGPASRSSFPAIEGGYVVKNVVEAGSRFRLLNTTTLLATPDRYRVA